MCTHSHWKYQHHHCIIHEHLFRGISSDNSNYSNRCRKNRYMDLFRRCMSSLLIRTTLVHPKQLGTIYLPSPCDLILQLPSNIGFRPKSSSCLANPIILNIYSLKSKGSLIFSLSCRMMEIMIYHSEWSPLTYETNWCHAWQARTIGSINYINEKLMIKGKQQIRSWNKLIYLAWMQSGEWKKLLERSWPSRKILFYFDRFLFQK